MWTRSWTEHSVVYSLNVLVRCQQTGGTSHFSLWRVNSYSPGLLKLCFGEVGTCKRGPLWAGKETEGTAQDTCLCSTLPNSDTCLCSTLPNSDTYRHGSLMTMPAGRLRGTERRQDQSENVFFYVCSQTKNIYFVSMMLRESKVILDPTLHIPPPTPEKKKKKKRKKKKLPASPHPH